MINIMKNRTVSVKYDNGTILDIGKVDDVLDGYLRKNSLIYILHVDRGWPRL